MDTRVIILERLGGGCRGALGRAFFRLPLAVQHVGPRDLLVAIAHQRQLDLVLDILDHEGAAAGLAPLEVVHHLAGQALDGFMHARGSRGLAAFHREVGLGHRDHDLFLVEGGQLAVSAQDVVRVGGAGLGDVRLVLVQVYRWFVVKLC